MPGAIAMGAVFLVTIVEMLFTRGHMCGGYHAHVPRDEESGMRSESAKDSKVMENDSGRPHRQSSQGSIEGVQQLDFVCNRGDWSSSMSHGLRALEEQQVHGSEHSVNTTAGVANHGLHKNEREESNNQLMNDPIVLTPEQTHKKALLQCVLLEIGILFHSVFIGMALSVTSGPGFIVLLIAIIFHRKMLHHYLPIILSEILIFPTFQKLLKVWPSGPALPYSNGKLAKNSPGLWLSLTASQPQLVRQLG